MNLLKHRERINIIRDKRPRHSTWDQYAAEVAKANNRVELVSIIRIGFLIALVVLTIFAFVALVVVLS